MLIIGETGSGKELVARALHRSGPRSGKRFVAINCSAVVETLFESELFGHMRGAFTGATDNKPGLFEVSHGGTLFLDEIGELPQTMQAKLLRVLETGEVQRVGSVSPTKVDVHVIAATNRDLRAETAAGRFRNDLYYRLNVVELRIAPLRERREDIPYLTAGFIRDTSLRLNKKIIGLTPSAERILVAGAWEGNVRELRNVVERACILADSEFLSERHFTSSVSQMSALSPGPGAEPREAIDDAPQADSLAPSSGITFWKCSRAPGATKRRPRGCWVSIAEACTGGWTPTDLRRNRMTQLSSQPRGGLSGLPLHCPFERLEQLRLRKRLREISDRL